MINKISRELFIKSRDGSTVYYLPESSSLRRAIIEVFEEQEDASTNDNYLKDQLNKKNNNHSILIILERIKINRFIWGSNS